MEISQSIILAFGLLLVSGIAAGLLVERIGLPRVAGYVLAGVVFSPNVLGDVIASDLQSASEPIANVCLGIIAFLIGGSITVPQLRHMGRVILVSALGESLGAVLTVGLAVWLLMPALDGRVPLALAAIAATTAPAATVAVLHQYRAKGPVSTTLLGVVAVDDAIGIILFSLFLVLATAQSWLHTMGLAAVDLVGAVVLGWLAGYGLSRISRRVRRGTLRFPLVFGGLLLVVGAAQWLGLSPLLASMAFGFALRLHVRGSGERVFGPLEYSEELVFVVFFTLAGAHFQWTLVAQYYPLIAIYLIARVAGKVVGAAAGAKLGGAEPKVVRWLGLGLVPQAGVAIGLALSLGKYPAFEGVTQIIVNVVLGSTMIYELVGPVLARLALSRAGELSMRRNG